MIGKTILVDYEKASTLRTPYYITFRKPLTRGGSKPNHHYIEWRMADVVDESSHDVPADHGSLWSKWSWFRETVASESIVHGWLPIEYYFSWDKNGMAGVIKGDPGLSRDDWMSSPCGFGASEQLEGALESDVKGNFYGFSGAYSEPVLSKQYGDFTGTGNIDIIYASTKSGRPFQGHKIKLWGGYEFREKTHNSVSLHTRMQGATDIVTTDLYESDRGTIRHCIAASKIGNPHGAELIHNRYQSGSEEKYIFIHITYMFLYFK